MVLKRKLPTQVAQEKEGNNNSSNKGEQNKPKSSSEPWVFAGGDSSDKKDGNKTNVSKEKIKSDPSPWSIESLEASGRTNIATPEKTKSADKSSNNEYPWAIGSPDGKKDDWNVAGAAQNSPVAGGAKAPLAPVNDVYGDVSKEKANQAKSKPAAGIPPWQSSSAGGSGTPPPILPISNDAKQGGGILKSIFMLLIVVGVFAGGYVALFKKRDEVAEVTARWTGTLNDVSQKPESLNKDDPQPENIVSFGAGIFKKFINDEPEKIAEHKAVQDAKKKNIKIVSKAEEGKNPNTKVDFVDVDKKESAEPIVADDNTEIPEDLSLFASLQAAIMKEKENKRTEGMAKASEGAPDVDPDTLSDEEKVKIGQELRKKTNKEMNDYVETLVRIKNPALKPKPSTFFENPEKYKKKAANYKLNKSVARKEDFTYNSNPKNLPIIPEPVVPTKPGVRVLADFDDNIFEVPRSKVRIPRKIVPRMGAAGFPSLEILSLVPHKGIIAFAKGREGILMIGEAIEGWELIYVQNEYAEFHNGKRKHIVSLDMIR